MARFIILLFIIIVAVAGGYFAYGNRATSESTVDDTRQQTSDAPRGKLMSVENYVTQNISALSPVAATMGGTFYVTNISVDPEARKGVVEYEDGHMNYTAHFTYTANDQTGYIITSFVMGQ